MFRHSIDLNFSTVSSIGKPAACALAAAADGLRALVKPYLVKGVDEGYEFGDHVGYSDSAQLMRTARSDTLLSLIHI